jgi:hypothetical protein
MILDLLGKLQACRVIDQLSRWIRRALTLHLQHDAANHLVRWRLILIMASMRVRKQSTGWSAKSPAK